MAVCPLTTHFARPFNLDTLVISQRSAPPLARSDNHNNSSNSSSSSHRQTPCSERTQPALAQASVVRFSTFCDASITLIWLLLAGGGTFGANTASAGGGLFGQPKPATGFGAFGGGGGAFGGGGGGTGTTSAFGTTGGTGGAFGQTNTGTTGTGTNLFGAQPSTSTGAFGGSNLFGQNKPATGAFGATPGAYSRQVASCFVSQHHPMFSPANVYSSGWRFLSDDWDREPSLHCVC